MYEPFYFSNFFIIVDFTHTHYYKYDSTNETYTIYSVRNFIFLFPTALQIFSFSILTSSYFLSLPQLLNIVILLHMKIITQSCFRIPNNGK